MVRQTNTGCVHRSYRGIHPSRNPITRINYRQTSFDLWLYSTAVFQNLSYGTNVPLLFYLPASSRICSMFAVTKDQVYMIKRAKTGNSARPLSPLVPQANCLRGRLGVTLSKATYISQIRYGRIPDHQLEQMITLDSQITFV